VDTGWRWKETEAGNEGIKSASIDISLRDHMCPHHTLYIEDGDVGILTLPEGSFILFLILLVISSLVVEKQSKAQLSLKCCLI
jgi:hypothetical protein